MSNLIPFPLDKTSRSRAVVDQALDYFLRADTPLAEEVSFELINMVVAIRHRRPVPPMPFTERVIRDWPLVGDQHCPRLHKTIRGGNT
jgi:hypothetical protein